MAELHAIRHSAAHVMAQAILELYPDAQLAFGPVTEDGFFYDVKLREGSITEKDLPKIQKIMRRIVQEKHDFERKEVTREEALEILNDQRFKVIALNTLLKDQETVSLYTQNGFIDLCKGPHVQNTKEITPFKVDRIAGSYWLGDSQNEPLQRVYGLCFETQEQLDEHVRLLEEAQKRDHRELGKRLDLFSFHEEGPGFPFWHPQGLTVFNLLVDYMREENRKREYQEIKTPLILNESLWHRSGHYDNFRDFMYFTSMEERSCCVKPMNCPGSILVFKEKLYSYRDLPLRLSEMGLVHRHELSGVLHGLFRVRAFTQDDAHVFTPEDRLRPEVENMIDYTLKTYRLFGFDEFEMFVATRPEKSIGAPEVWERATRILVESLEGLNMKFGIKEGEGAFYGPKIEFNVRDCLKRNWQLGTIQIDFSLPERFDIQYVGKDGSRHRPIMVHRAILGSFERFVGILLEQTEGSLPVWLSPVQAAVLPITDGEMDYAGEVVRILSDRGFRVELFDSGERLNKRIRNAQLRKIPYMLVVGGREKAEGTVSVRLRTQEDLGSIPLPEFLERAKSVVLARSLLLWEKKESPRPLDAVHS
jgi:threonyl-tRNA synthetase